TTLGKRSASLLVRVIANVRRHEQPRRCRFFGRSVNPCVDTWLAHSRDRRLYRRTRLGANPLFLFWRCHSSSWRTGVSSAESLRRSALVVSSCLGSSHRGAGNSRNSYA